MGCNTRSRKKKNNIKSNEKNNIKNEGAMPPNVRPKHMKNNVKDFVSKPMEKGTYPKRKPLGS